MISIAHSKAAIKQRYWLFSARPDLLVSLDSNASLIALRTGSSTGALYGDTPE
jgi:hypothetical protein